MGLRVDWLTFGAGRPPTEEEVRAYMREHAGDARGIEACVASIVEGDNVVELRTLLDPTTRPYALSFLRTRGGTPIDRRTLNPLPLEPLPGFVARPWREHSAWFRFAERLAFHWRLLTHRA
jgi:hypothetical protein